MRLVNGSNASDDKSDAALYVCLNDTKQDSIIQISRVGNVPIIYLDHARLHSRFVEAALLVLVSHVKQMEESRSQLTEDTRELTSLQDELTKFASGTLQQWIKTAK